MKRTKKVNSSTPARTKPGPKGCQPWMYSVAEDLVGKLGARNKELAQYFEVGLSTVEGWITNIPEFAAAVRRGRVKNSLIISKALFSKAKGYEYMESVLTKVETKEYYPNGKIKSVRVEPTIIEVPKQLPPDAYAAHKYLSIIQREIWAEVSTHKIDHTHSGEVIHRKIEEISFDELSEPVKNMLFDLNMIQLSDGQNN